MLIFIFRSLDVLDVISKILSFSEEQLITCGLRNNSQQNLLTSLLSNFIPITPEGLTVRKKKKKKLCDTSYF